MYTLDEVIKACEECLSHNEFCYQCIYNSDECLTDQKEEDCLYYLREYKQMKEHLACMDNGEIRGDNTQVVNNPSLTWEELGKMEGKPVWIESYISKRGEWHLAHKQYDDELYLTDIHGYVSSAKKENLGITWEAYRKEHHERTE